MADDGLAAADYDDELKALLLQKAKVEARKAIATASTPDLPAAFPRGALEFGDKGSVVAALEACGLLTEVASEVASAIAIDTNNTESQADKPRIILVDSLDQASGYATFRRVDSQLTSLADMAETTIDLLPAPPKPRARKARESDEVTRENFIVAPVVGAAIGLGAKALPLLLDTLKTDYSVQTREVDLDFAAVAAAVSRHLLARGFEVSLRTMRPLIAESSILSRVHDLATQRLEVLRRQQWCQIHEVDGGPKSDLAAAQSRLEALRKASDSATAAKRAPAAKRVAAQAATVAELQSVVDGATFKVKFAQTTIDSIDAFVTQLFAEAAGATAPVIVAAMSEQLASDERTFLLWVKTVVAGGESIYERRVGTDKAHHVGGVSVAWMLTGREGIICSAGIQTQVGQLTSSIGEAIDQASSQRIGLAFEDTDPTPPGLTNH